MKTHILCLQELPVFKTLSNNEFIEEICKKTVKLHVKKDRVLFHQGDKADFLYLVKSGLIKLVRYNSEGNSKILEIIGPRECIGENAFWSANYEFEAVAMEDSNLCCYSFELFRSSILENPRFSEKIIKYLGQKLDDNMFCLKEDETLLVKGKLLRLLEKLANDHGEALENGSVIIKIIITQNELAGMLGVSRMMVNDALKKLKEDNLVNKQGRYYVITPDGCLLRNIKKFKEK